MSPQLFQFLPLRSGAEHPVHLFRTDEPRADGQILEHARDSSSHAKYAGTRQLDGRKYREPSRSWQYQTGPGRFQRSQVTVSLSLGLVSQIGKVLGSWIFQSFISLSCSPCFVTWPPLPPFWCSTKLASEKRVTWHCPKAAKLQHRQAMTMTT